MVCQEQCFSVTSAGGSVGPGSDEVTSKVLPAVRSKSAETE